LQQCQRFSLNYKDARLFHTTVSPPLSEIVFIVNKKSNNLYTEQLLKMVGVKLSGEGSISKGVEGIRKFLAEMNVSDKGMRLFDGSGLSRNNMITPQMMGKMLICGKQQGVF
jgi:serine-type D-Ala-D-Ala carboxypeptidase/endopeptidase (penicillin-binding protein 4)